MPSSVHKVLVFSALGCGGLVIVGMVASFIFVLHQDPDFLTRTTSEVMYTPEQSRAALDSFTTIDFPPPDPRAGAFQLHVSGADNGAAMALRVWRDTSYRHPIAFGDTVRPGSSRWAIWIAAAAWPAVDSLLAAARRPWSLTGGAIEAPPGEAGVFSKVLLNTQAVLSTTRAMLARARSVVEDAPGRADTLVYAVFTIGRRLEEDAEAYHAILGCRLQHDALTMYAGLHHKGRSGDVLAVLQDVDDRLARYRRAVRLIRAAGALPEQANALPTRARDAALPLPLRGELVLAVGYGWTVNPAEAQRISPLRTTALRQLGGGILPPSLGMLLEAARDAAAAGFSERLVLPSEYQSRYFTMAYEPSGVSRGEATMIPEKKPLELERP